MKRLTAVWLIVGALMLAACAGDKQTKATNSLAIGCDTVATILDQLAPRRASGSLSLSAVSKVNSIKAVTDKFCLPDSPFDPAVAMAAVDNAIQLLKGI